MRPEILARIAAARAARDLSDLARQAVGATAEPVNSTERIRRARELRQMVNEYVDRVVLGEALAGADWQEISKALNRRDPKTVEGEYADAVAEWSAHEGEGEADAEGEGAEDLDAWYARHREDHDPDLEKPVADLLNRH
ncbi:hypothetical protein [Streptomyces stelliscabiei]|uniref:hypothetical protein n=1 Tax=Streptomyces stelliscabiei TaxID=146820 RepID=UPI0029B2A0E8|nr:hypothetical protein [Streptomyces stelliscabiei]MDX2557724.1 hypothetical protein [Streptomyces stelliscabiei]MDX2617430.1 hypothetical protein [Streptomyces stelliscabiei]MDX2641583.1 hypothetical protein [Streptomyces stelliscabiei]MDX2667542.1 hypothetical protein [Streptomyces stelliscabiei]MDX2715850.1 hypothetical protein [Streptomyces stelliscabiei]